MRRKDRESGYILVGALLAITILAVVGTSLVTLSTSSVKTSSAERDNQAVYYIAEAGLNYLASEFEEAIEEIYEKDHVKTESDFYREIDKLDKFPDKYDNFEKVNNDKPKALLDIEKIDEETDLYKMTSTGYIGDEKRVVTQQVQVEWREKYEEVEGGEYELPPFAVFTSGQFTMSNGTIIGDIGTVNKQSKAINFPSGGPTLDGDIYVPDGNSDFVNQSKNKGNSEIKVLNESYKIPQLPTFPEIPKYDCPEDATTSVSEHNKYDVIKDCNLRIDNWVVRDSNYTLVMNENMEFNEIKFASGYKLKIDVKDENKIIVVNHLNMTNGHIELLGSGNLTIYVKNKITFGSDSTINNLGDVSRLNMYYKGKERVELAGSQKVYGSLYAENANLYLTGSGGIYGNIFTGGTELQMTGGSDIKAQLILAPNAKVKMTAGGNIEGMIISKEFDNSGGAKVTLNEPFIINGPISPSALGGGDNNNGGSGGTGGSEFTETGAKPSISKEKVREEVN